MPRFAPEAHELPDYLAIFPLPGVLLLPGQALPLNIFEDRYLNLFEDAMAQGRMVGMIQPRDPDDDELRTQIISGVSPLFDIGGMGRITHFEETPDGRFVIRLLGVCRFALESEAVTDRGYRRAKVSWTEYLDDLNVDGGGGDAGISGLEQDVDRKAFMAVLKRYLNLSNMNLDANILEKTPLELLVDALAMISPFDPPEKQALLESKSLQDRARMLLTLMEIAVHDKNDGRGPLTN
ncbi:MAG: LON peptidase substrate-binding domain-containing protein [Alphaproteobacteria bacterium]|nr:LON peptidase substrate-binding domain-containing protein [Alphaproteobacteria bacterium]